MSFLELARSDSKYAVCRVGRTLEGMSLEGRYSIFSSKAEVMNGTVVTSTSWISLVWTYSYLGDPSSVYNLSNQFPVNQEIEIDKAFVVKKILLMSFLARFRVSCPLLTQSPVIVFFIN